MVLFKGYDVFHSFIVQILIFERGVIWKTFVEFINADQAIKARLSLNGQDFGDDTSLKMNVYAS